MPFDGSDFPQFQPSMPIPLAPARLSFWARLTWFLRAPQYGLEVQLPAPAEIDRCSGLQAACLLRAARNAIAAEENWAQRAYRTADGRRCAIGALRAAAKGRYGQGAGAEAHRYLLAVAQWRGFDSVEAMNDHSSHAEVLTAFDAAIVSAENA